jgi:hypothetical protein
MLFGLSVPALASTEADYLKTEWRVDEAKLSCTPKRLGPTDTLIINMPVPHFKELAVYYPKSRRWWFLVYFPDSSTSESKPIMPSSEFVKTPVVKLKVSEAKGTLWVGKTEDEHIFVEPGTYSIFLSDILESEVGGYTCTVEYVPSKK